MQKSIFQFTLKPPEQCAFPGGNPFRISWFYLTDSWYYLDLGDTRLFESSPEQIRKYPGERYLDYYYIRWLEDFFDILPQVLSPIPADLYALISDEQNACRLKNCMDSFFDRYETPEGDIPEKVWDIYEDCSKLLYYGQLDTGFLRFKSFCRFCRLEEEIVLQYDFRDRDKEGDPVWSAEAGEYRIGYEEFLAQITAMLDSFFRSMDTQIAQAVEMVRNHPGIYAASKGQQNFYEPDAIAAFLREEHNQRKDFFSTRLAAAQSGKASSVSWEQVRNALERAEITL